MTKVYGLFVKNGFTDRNSKTGHLLHLFIAKENANSELGRLQYDYPDHIFFVKPISLDDA